MDPSEISYFFKIAAVFKMAALILLPKSVFGIKTFSKFDKSLKSDNCSLQSSSRNREESLFLIMAEFVLKMAEISKMAFVILI